MAYTSPPLDNQPRTWNLPSLNLGTCLFPKLRNRPVCVSFSLGGWGRFAVEVEEAGLCAGFERQGNDHCEDRFYYQRGAAVSW